MLQTVIFSNGLQDDFNVNIHRSGKFLGQANSPKIVCGGAAVGEDLPAILGE